MRRTLMSVLALALLGCAALATSVAPATGASQSAQASPPRVFFIVYADSRTLFGGSEDDETSPPGYGADSTEEDGSSAGADDSTDDEDGTQEAPVSIPATVEGQFRVLLESGLADGAYSYEDAMNGLELPFMFAGREQWIRNLGGGGVEGEPRLWDVTMESIVRDGSARYLLLGRAAETAARGLSGADDLSYWRSLVPSWAPRVRDELAKKGVPFSVELLADPDINISDPSKPLFSKNAAPLSLFSLGVLQKGESIFLRSLSAEELMLEVWPAYYRYYHRAAGAPVPADLLAGMSFGNPIRQPDGTYLRSPMMTSDAYKRWQQYGYPGTIADSKVAELTFNNITDGTWSWFEGQYSLFAPTSVSPDVIARYRELAEGK